MRTGQVTQALRGSTLWRIPFLAATALIAYATFAGPGRVRLPVTPQATWRRPIRRASPVSPSDGTRTDDSKLATVSRLLG